MSDLIYGLEELDRATPEYKKAEIYHKGLANEKFTSAELQKALGSESSDFNLNYARVVVESRLSRLSVASITAQDNDQANEALDFIWNINQLDQEYQDAFEGALRYGDSYLIAWPKPEGEEGVDIFYNDPYNTRVFYEEENPRRKSFAIKRWQTNNDKLRVNLYYVDRIEKYISTVEVNALTGEDEDFVPFIDAEDGETWPLPNETEEIPVFHLRTSRQYGTPEHFHAYGAQNAINKLMRIQMVSVDYNATPQRYFLQNPEATNSVDIDADFAGAQGNDSNTNQSGSKPNLVQKPAGIWKLDANIKSVGQFDPTSPEVFIKPFTTFVEAMSSTTSTPMHSFNFGTPPSGESLRAAEMPLNKRVISLQLSFGSVIRELHEFALNQYDAYKGTKVIVGWAPPATYDDKEVWDKVKTKIEAGVPADVALMEAGYTDAQITEWRENPAAQHRNITELERMANAIVKLNALTGAPVLTRAEVRRMLPQDFLDQTAEADPEAVEENLSDIDVLIKAGVSEEEARARVEGSSS